MNSPPGPLRPLARIAFAIYSAALLTATHWPGLSVSGPIDRTDLIIHAGALCIWTCLFYLARFVGGTCPTRRLIWAGVAGICFAAFDETTQPLFRRVFDWWDLLADSVGVLIGLSLIVGARRVWPSFRADLGS
ncbi:MAG: VanZ family protein [Phycisphaerales bacterium JB052]